jgi:Tfp pilus assembly protein PilN
VRSFIKPRKKRLFDEVSLLWILFIVFVSVGLVLFGFLLRYKSSFYIKMLDNLQAKNSTQIKNVKQLQNEITLIKTQGELLREVNSSNNALKASMKNLFDLIPDQITLIKVVMDKKSLYLKGYTKSKEAYSLLLEPPLKSVFTKSKVKFERDDRGRLMFESLNTIEENQPKQVTDGSANK